MPIAICMTFVKYTVYCIVHIRSKTKKIIMLNATLYTSWYFLMCQRHCPIICTMWDPDPDSVYLLIWNNLPNNPCHRPGNVHGCLKSTFHETRLENSACLLAEVLTWAPMANEGRHTQCTTWVNVVLLVTRNTPRTSSGKNSHLQKSNLMVKACIEDLLPEIWQPSICCQSFLWHIAHQPARPETNGIRRIS